MVDFSFIVSLYVSDLPNVTKSTILWYTYQQHIPPFGASASRDVSGEMWGIVGIAFVQRAAHSTYSSGIHLHLTSNYKELQIHLLVCS